MSSCFLCWSFPWGEHVQVRIFKAWDIPEESEFVLHETSAAGGTPQRAEFWEPWGVCQGRIHPFAALGSPIHSPCQAGTHPHPFILRRWLARGPWAVVQRWISTTDRTTRIWHFLNTIMHFQPVYFAVPTHGFSESCHHVVAAFCMGAVFLVSCPFWAKLGPIFALCSYFQIIFFFFSKNPGRVSFLLLVLQRNYHN